MQRSARESHAHTTSLREEAERKSVWIVGLSAIITGVVLVGTQ